MTQSLEIFDTQNWDNNVSDEMRKKAVASLEEGKVLFFPSLSFSLTKEELKLLTPSILSPKSKNISYTLQKDLLAGTSLEGEEALLLKAMIKRFALQSRALMDTFIPEYKGHLIQARTSFRPAEVEGRKSSYRKDDTRLHVDAFPSSPTRGTRILRVFANVNQEGKPRVWKTGESFAAVVEKMLPHVSAPIPGMAQALKFLGITKGLRSPYDHYMLNIHDAMKRDTHYQKTVFQEEVRFPPGTTWAVYTDQVSHAALAGQHMLEQTFHIPVEGLSNPSTSPLKVLEKILQQSLT